MSTCEFRTGILSPNFQTADHLISSSHEGIPLSVNVNPFVRRFPPSFAEHSSLAFDEFLSLIGQKVKLQSFDRFKGGLDNKSKRSVVASSWSSSVCVCVLLCFLTLCLVALRGSERWNWMIGIVALQFEADESSVTLKYYGSPQHLFYLCTTLTSIGLLISRATFSLRWLCRCWQNSRCHFVVRSCIHNLTMLKKSHPSELWIV